MKKLIKLFTAILFIIMCSSTEAQWFSQNNPEPNHNLYDVFAIDEMISISVGESNTILKTTDGGENWLSKSDSSTEYRYYTSVQFINNSTGWIVGGGSIAYGGASRILKTTDTGENWTSDSIGSGGLSSVCFVDQNTGWAVGSSQTDLPSTGIMFKTTNGGNNWISQNNGSPCPLSFVFFINQNIGWVGGYPFSWWGWGSDSTIIKSTDGGNTWQSQLLDSIACLSGYFINENLGWIIGNKWIESSYQGVLFKTTNGGNNWLSQILRVGSWVSDVYFINENIGWVVGSDGIILKTTDGGNNWINQESGTNNDLYAVHFIDENTGWAIGGNGTILKTTNGGGTIPVELTTLTASSQNGYAELNWTTATEINNQGFEVQRSISSSEFITVGFVEGEGTTTEEHHYSYKDKDVSGLLHYRLKQVDFDGSYEYSEIVEVVAFGITSYELLQNYPNPFNPGTKIEYSVPQSSQVSLKIFNALGEEIETLVNEEKPVGNYKLSWNAASAAGGLPSGIYFYQLRACNYVGTKKMVLMK